METNIVFIIDKSGSMRGMQNSVISGYNKIIGEHRDADAKITVCIFDDKIIFNGIKTPGDKAALWTERDYIPDGCTALNDAIGMTLDTMNRIVRENEQVMVFIITDGMENASSKYSYSDVKELIEKAKGKDWQIVFMGANIDAQEEARKRGIDAENAVDFIADSDGADKCFDAMSENVMCFMTTRTMSPKSFDKVRKDYKKRSRK